MNRFVVVTSTDPLPPALVGAIDRRVATGDGHERRRVVWSDRAGTVHYFGTETDPPTTTIDEHGLLAAAGTPRAARRILGELTEAHQNRPDDIADAHALVQIGPDGEGYLGRDPLGVHPLFVAESATVGILGNRAELVADSLALVQQRPVSRSALAGAWLAFCGFVMDDSTGFTGVRRLAQDRRIRIRHGRFHEEPTIPLWRASPDEEALDPEEVVDQLEADITAAVTHALEASTRPPRLELTGGKDSRAILSVAHRAGLVGDLELVTFGPPDLPDMVVARELAGLVGATHVDISAEHVRAAARLTTTERLRRHVRRTSGMSFLGDANEPPDDPRVTISGLFGEAFRIANRRERVDPVMSADEAVARFRGQRPLGDRGLLLPDVQHRCMELAVAFFLDAADAIRSPSDLRAAHFLRRRVPGWQAPLVDQHQRRVLAFYAPETIRSAFRVDPSHRATEQLHARLVRRAGPAITALPFANDQWHDGPPPRTTIVGAPDAKRASNDLDLPATLHELLTARPDNPAFEIIDRQVLEREVATVSSASAGDRRQILGAMTAVMWLGDLDKR